MVQCNCDDATGNVASNDGLMQDGDTWKDYDGDAVTFVLVDNVSNGTLDFDTATGEFTYVQNEGYLGDDSFTYQITDGVGTSTQTATVALAVEGKTVPATPPTITATFTFDGNSTASAEKGTPPPTDEVLWLATGYYKQYDGPTKFTGEYTINLNPDGTFKAAGSFVKFVMVNFTDWAYITRNSADVSAADEAAYVKAGKRVVRVGDKCFIYYNETLATTPAFETHEIPITDITIVDGRLHSFKFVGATWYKDLPTGFTDKGITGEIDLKKCTGKWTAKYEEESKDVIAIYDVTGKLK